MKDSRPKGIGECMDCKYYFDKDTPISVGCGECRYGPPTALPIFGHGYYHERAFPLVSEYDWCWRFEDKSLGGGDQVSYAKIR